MLENIENSLYVIQRKYMKRRRLRQINIHVHHMCCLCEVICILMLWIIPSCKKWIPPAPGLRSERVVDQMWGGAPHWEPAQQQLRLGPELLAGLQLTAVAQTEQPLLAGDAGVLVTRAATPFLDGGTELLGWLEGGTGGGERLLKVCAGGARPPHIEKKTHTHTNWNKWHNSRHGWLITEPALWLVHCHVC